jgi:hypothetical protein
MKLDGYSIVNETFEPDPSEKELLSFRSGLAVWVNGKLAVKKWIIARTTATNRRLYFDKLSSFLLIPLPPYFYISWKLIKDIAIPYKSIKNIVVEHKKLTLHIRADNNEIIMIFTMISQDKVNQLSQIIKKYK